MARPILGSRIEEGYNFTGTWINADKVRPFVQVALVTSKSEIGFRRRPAMLPGLNVFDVESVIAVLLLVNAAILATILCPLSNELA